MRTYGLSFDDLLLSILHGISRKRSILTNHINHSLLLHLEMTRTTTTTFLPCRPSAKFSTYNLARIAVSSARFNRVPQATPGTPHMLQLLAPLKASKADAKVLQFPWLQSHAHQAPGIPCLPSFPWNGVRRPQEFSKLDFSHGDSRLETTNCAAEPFQKEKSAAHVPCELLRSLPLAS